VAHVGALLVLALLALLAAAAVCAAVVTFLVLWRDRSCSPEDDEP
jgi:hypothetical protein